MKHLRLYEDFEDDKDYNEEELTGEQDGERRIGEEGLEDELADMEEDDIDELVDMEEDDIKTDGEVEGVDLAIEYENMARTIPKDSNMTVDDFFDEFGVEKQYRSDFGWAAILKNAEVYKDMPDDKFFKIYNEYKNKK